MTLKTIREMRDNTPFIPFDIHTSDGKAVRVSTTDHLFFPPGHAEFFVVSPQGKFFFIDPEHVTTVAPVGLPPKAAKK